MIPAAINPPNELASMLAPYRIAMRGGSSDRLYQHERSKNTPGRNGPSMRPKTNRHMNNPAKLVVKAWHIETMPQPAVTEPMYNEGFTFRIKMFDGT
jgi:hypothetical protein